MPEGGEESGKKLVRWSYGIGEEGRKVISKQTCHVVIVDSVFPCWMSAAKAVGLSISKIWLTQHSVFASKYLNDFAGNVDIEFGPGAAARVVVAARSAEWILIGGAFPSSLNTKDVWTANSLKGIVVTSGLNFKPPKNWRVTYHTLRHSEVGGVTDGTFKFVAVSRFELGSRIRYDMTPGQDLRAILKSGGVGTRTMNLSLPGQRDPVDSVVYCGKNVVEEASLWPLGKKGVKVKTRWRSTFWIERELVSMERLLAMDVSEKLIRSIPEGQDRTLLIHGIHTPGKVLFATLSYVLKRAGVKESSSKRKREEQGSGEELKRCKHNAQLALPEWIGELVSETLPKIGSHRVGISPKGLRDLTSRLVSLGDDDEDIAASIVIPLATGSSVQLGDDVKFSGDPNIKATKSDGAAVRVGLWEKYVQRGISDQLKERDLERGLVFLRDRMLRRWKRNITSSYLKWARFNDDDKNRLAARDCIQRAANASWWSWDDGSRPFFWRWPRDYQVQVRDGAKIYFEGRVIPSTQTQKVADEEDRCRMITGKLRTIRDKRYVEVGPITSLMSYFDVAKGEDDIRMVYDGSASGLNGQLWAPWFSLPLIDCLVRALEPGYCMADNDVGEMFHNFMLNAELRKFCGMDFTPYFKDEVLDSNGKIWMRWNRLAMGLRPSPYCAVQAMMYAKEMIMGDKLDASNVFRWDRMRLNLPGDAEYEPSKAWAVKVRSNGEVAADVFIYVDDVRVSAPTQIEAWQASQRVSNALAQVGVQDAARKRRDASIEAGAWTGSVAWTSGGQVSIKTTQEKWDKTKLHLAWIVKHMDDPKGMDLKMLLSIRGFLVYVSRTYTSMVPYLKGLHGTIDSWRTGRTPEGYPLSRNQKRRQEIKRDQPADELVDDDYIDWDVKKFGQTPVSGKPPAYVFPLYRLRDDVQCLLSLTEADEPPNRKVRMSKQAKVVYGFGDASKSGFGASIELPDKSIIWRFGQWTLEQEREEMHPGIRFDEEVSSNYRELRNLVEALESAFEEGLLVDREVFMFTDNSTAESAYAKGSSKSPHLFDLVLRLRKLDMTGLCVIHLVHVAGTRMIHQGTDGLSRGDKTSGIMAGETMLTFVPLHLSAFDRSSLVRDWLQSVLELDGEGGEMVKMLEPSDWPESHAYRATFVWVPPPAIADVAAEYMAQAIHKRPSSTHIFLCPRLMTYRWRRTVQKASSLLVSVPVGTPIWGTDQHEPLILAISLPLSRDRPWKHGGSPSCEHYGKILPELFANNFSRASSILRECIIRAYGMAEL